MSKPGGYLLNIPRDRREDLLAHALIEGSIGEPVPRFGHSRKAPLLVFASFRDGMITHLADGRKGVASGTGLVRLNLSNVQELNFPIDFQEIRDSVYGRTAPHILKRIEDGGFFPPATFQDFLEIIGQLSAETAERLLRFGAARLKLIEGLSPEKKNSLAQQKEGVGFAIKIAGLDMRELLDWQPTPDGEYASFLDGMPGARLREDAMVVHDLDHVPGYELVSSNQTGARVFSNNETKLTVILANKLPLEEQFGADLIYYNETHRSFIMVQYKAMEQRDGGVPEFRLPSKQLAKEIARMDSIQGELDKIPDEGDHDAFRLNAAPFFMKLCKRHSFNPDDCGLFPGFYIPIEYWKRIVVSPETLGPKGGRLITADNIGRRFTEDGFVSMIGGGWIGTSPAQSDVLGVLVRSILVSGKAVIFAVEQGA